MNIDFRSECVLEVKRKYGLVTSISMIVGIVIGSGIFFKSNSVLEHTKGNVGLGVLAFVIAAIAIIFGSLTLAELALRTDKEGGIIAYAEEALGRKGAIVFGWFQSFVYFPSVITMLGFVIGSYICVLMGWPAHLMLQIGIGLAVLSLILVMNFFSAKYAGYFQNAAVIIKLIPLLTISVVGLFFSNPDFSLLTNFSTMATDTSWVGAIAPIAFIYDGWSVATNISHEIKDVKRNLPLALIIAPLFVLAVYLMYFIGLSFLIGPDQILAAGTEHVNIAMNLIFGPLGSKILLVVIIVSIMGGANGMLLSNTRTLYVLGKNNMMPFSKKLSQISERFNTPTFASVVAIGLITVWSTLHYFTTKYRWLGNSDVSEISVVTVYILFTVLYIYVIHLRRKKIITSNIRGYVIPCMAILGSFIMLYGGMQSPMFILYSVLSLMSMVIAYIYALITEKPIKTK